MCDRNKDEILARELAIEFFSGAKHEPFESPIEDFVENNWEYFLSKSKRIQTILEKHK